MTTDLSEAMAKGRAAHNARVQAEYEAQQALTVAYHGPESWCHDNACPSDPGAPLAMVGLPLPSLLLVVGAAVGCRVPARRGLARDAATAIVAHAERRRWWQR